MALDSERSLCRSDSEKALLLVLIREGNFDEPPFGSQVCGRLSMIWSTRRFVPVDLHVERGLASQSRSTAPTREAFDLSMAPIA